MYLLFVVFLSASAAPTSWVQKIAETMHFENFENYLPKRADLPKYQYSTFLDDKDPPISNRLGKSEVIFRSMDDQKRDEALSNVPIKEQETTTVDVQEFTTTDQTTTVEDVTVTTETVTETTTTMEDLMGMSQNYKLDPVLERNMTGLNDTSNRQTRQENENELSDNSVSESGEDMNSNQTEGESSEEEEDGNMITSLLSAFIGGLSRPDGSVDVEAITGLLGSLSTQNADGSYDFSGLTDILMSFFGGGGEEGGGSDFGAFLGGIAGAFIKGVANPPGAKGAGIFAGNLLGGVLPGLSAPAPPKEGEKPQEGLDSGGFIAGLLSSVFGSSSGPPPAEEPPKEGGGSKFQLFKGIFSLITSLFTSSSGSSSKH